MSVRLGFIGLGRIAQAHMSALSSLENARIVSVYDIDTARAHEVARTLHAKAFEHADDVIDPSRIDALFVCSPPFGRNHVEEAAARKGIHIFVEKPLGLDLAVVRRKERVINESGVINSVGYSLRYLDTVQKARAYLAHKQVDLVMGYYFARLHPPSWWRQLDLSGGQFVDQSTHQVDLIRYLASDIAEVQAQFKQRSIHRADPDATIYDVGTVSLKLKSGGIGTMILTCNNAYHARSGLELMGHDFYVQIEGKSLKIIDAERESMEVSRLDSIVEQDRAFVQAVASGSQDIILSSYSESLRTLAVTLAANQSAAERRPVEIPDH